MSIFIASWLAGAAELLEAEFSRPVDLLPGAAIAADAARFTLMADLAGDWEGTFTVTVEEAALAGLFAGLGSAAAPSEELPADAGGSPAPGRGTPREEWERLFRKICINAAAHVGVKTGRSCEVAMISAQESEPEATGMGYQLRSGEAMVALLIADQVEAAAPEPPRGQSAPPPSPAPPVSAGFSPPSADPEPAPGWAGGAAFENRGIDLLRGVELEASLRFGSREMALSDLLALGPGDVIQLDRALTDPVDLIIGDKIVARGEVVLVNGNFGLQVTEVAEPQKSLESIRCLF